MQPWKSSAESPESQSISEGHIGRSDTTTSISLRAGFDASDDENLQRGTSSREDDRMRHLKRASWPTKPVRAPLRLFFSNFPQFCGLDHCQDSVFALVSSPSAWEIQLSRVARFLPFGTRELSDSATEMEPGVWQMGRSEVRTRQCLVRPQALLFDRTIRILRCIRLLLEPSFLFIQ